MARFPLQKGFADAGEIEELLREIGEWKRNSGMMGSKLSFFGGNFSKSL
jgi:hypothetical protein